MTAARLLLAGLLAAIVAFAQPSPWSYVPPDSAPMTYFEWRKVLNSPYSELVRREIPPAVSAILGGINFVEGIDRVLVAGAGKPALIVMQGKFDPNRLHDLASRDGGTAKPYKNAEIFSSPGSGEDETAMALIGETMVLVAERPTLISAIDRSLTRMAPVVRSNADLWVFERRPAPGVESQEFALYMADGLRMQSKIIAMTAEHGRTILDNARALDLVSTQSEGTVTVMGNFSREDFARRLGQWRIGLQQLTPVTAEVQSAPERPGRKVRILGLDDGVKEVQLEKPAAK